MNNKNSKHFLDETVQRAKIENAQREAEQIYNYNKWKDNHENIVEPKFIPLPQAIWTDNHLYDGERRRIWSTCVV